MVPKIRKFADSQSDSAGPSSPITAQDAHQQSSFARSAANWSLEQDYEQRPRKKRKQEKENTRLPIKTPEGTIEKSRLPEIDDEHDNSGFEVSESEDEAVIAENSVPSTQPETSKVSSREQIIQAKEELARIASLLNEDPEENAGLFRTLSNIATSQNVTVKKLAVATQLAVYKDVIPGYRIRPLGDEDHKVKVSKDVRRLRSFEQALVGGYQTYLKQLAQLSKAGSKTGRPDTSGLATIAISCACNLLAAVPHFNFRGELLKIIITKLAGKRVPGDEDFDQCREALEQLFRNDEDGTPSLDAVAMLTKMMKARDYRVDESVLNTFLHLRLLSEFSSKGSQTKIDPTTNDQLPQKRSKKERVFRTKKQRKIEKERKVVDKQMREADATVSHEERDRMQAETLKLVFVTYFRILKARTPSLMGAVLEGLAKYAHLINQDFFGDLLEALKDLIGHADAEANEDEADDGEEEEDDSQSARSPTRETLLCIVTAFALLEGQTAGTHSAVKNTVLNLDLSFFITHLYAALHPLALNPDIELSAKSLHLPDPDVSAGSLPTAVPKTKINVQTTTALLLRALSAVLLPPASSASTTKATAVPPLRLAAFTKQLLTCALQLPERSAQATLALLTAVTKVHKRRLAALWRTEETRADGMWDPLRREVEGSGVYSATVWEGELLRVHYSPKVREGVLAVEGNMKGVV